jgi:hypothetical protein
MSISSWDIGEEQDVIQGSVPPPLSVLMNGSVWLSDLIKEFQRQSRSEGRGHAFSACHVTSDANHQGSRLEDEWLMQKKGG